MVQHGRGASPRGGRTGAVLAQVMREGDAELRLALVVRRDVGHVVGEGGEVEEALARRLLARRLLAAGAHASPLQAATWNPTWGSPTWENIWNPPGRLEPS